MLAVQDFAIEFLHHYITSLQDPTLHTRINMNLQNNRLSFADPR
jgi:hypothetical protein